MIDLGRPALHAESATLFADHADPAQFYYLPDCPRLRSRSDGAPELSLLKYQLDPALHHTLGAGLLSLTVDLGLDDAVRERLGARLRAQFFLDRQPILSPVAAESGSCEILIIDQTSVDKGAASGGPGAENAGPDLVERVLSAGSPSLYGDNAATFMAVLDAEGVSLVEQSLKSGGLPVGVVYVLQALALRPAFRAQLTARWQEVYRYYENRLHGGKLLLATDIGATVQDLLHSEALAIVVDDFLPPDQKDDAYQHALDQMQRYVLDQMFKPTLGSAPPPAADSSDGPLATIGSAIKDFAGFFSVTYTLKKIDRSELKTLTYQLNAASAERLTLAPQGTLSILLQGKTDNPIDASRVITEVAAAASQQMDFDVGAAIDLDSEGIDHIEAFLSYGGHDAAAVLDAATPRRTTTFWHEAESGFAVKYRYETHFKPGGGAASLLRSAELASEDRVIRIDPRELYRRVGLRVIAEGVPFDRFPTVIVDLKAADPASGWSSEQTLQLDAAHPEAGWFVRAAPDAMVNLQRRLRYVDANGSETSFDWDNAEPGVLVVGTPFPEVLDVAIVGSAEFGAVVRRIIVELRVKSDPGKTATKILTADQPFASWSAPLANREDRAYEYRVTIYTVRNEVKQGQWLAGSGGALVVGESIARLRQIQFVFVGRSLQDLGLFGVKLRLAFDDAEADLHVEDERLLQDLSKPVQWSCPVADPARQAFVYQLSLIHADGRIEQRDPVTTEDLLVVVPLT